MKSASTVYDALQGFVRQSAWADVRHMAVLVWMMIGMIEEGKVNLTCWISRVQTKAVYAQSTQRRFSRWLHNPRINVARLYGPIIQAALSKWQDSELLLSLDTSMLWDSYCIIRLSVVYRGRAIPVGWRVIEHKSSSVQLSVYQDLLKRVAGLLPSGVKVVLLADRGFVDAELMRYVRNSLNWHYRIRLKGNVWFYRAGRGWRQVKQLHLTAGEAVLLHQVRVYKKHSLTGVHLAVAKVAGTNEDWYLLSSEPTTLKTLAEYGLRFSIEENFLDDKSNGFELERSMIRNSIALSRLCFVIALSTLFLTLQGTAVVAAGKRRWVDPHWQRGSSYLKIGWSWVKGIASKGWTLFPVDSLKSMVDPDPAFASRWEREQRQERLEFKVRFA
jgi:Transposase DDE domain